jgi:ornithine--oxo-acid transaminase
VFEDNFHGRTTTIVGFSTEEGSRSGFGPFTPGFTLLPYGDAGAVERGLSERGDRIAAVLVEPIQGEAGIVVPPDGYLRRLRELTEEHRALLVIDEIQSGLGRTGKLFAFEHEGVRPDAVIVGKALSGGMYPVSGILASDEVMGVFDPGSHGSTYGGNPLAAAVAVEALRVIVDEKLAERSAELGAYALERLRSSTHPTSRRSGAGASGSASSSTRRPAARAASARRSSARACSAKETHTHVIRMAPPLVITREELDWSLERIGRVLAAS